MKIYKSSDLTHKRAEVLKEAAINGVIIQERNTNGDVRRQFVLISDDKVGGIPEVDSGKLDKIFIHNYDVNKEIYKPLDFT